jgi:hypothetical protein
VAREVPHKSPENKGEEEGEEGVVVREGEEVREAVLPLSGAVPLHFY